jgi:hypothetical protein
MTIWRLKNCEQLVFDFRKLSEAFYQTFGSSIVDPPPGAFEHLTQGAHS